MYKQRTVGAMKASSDVNKAKKKRTIKIVKGGKAKNKQIKAPKEATTPSETGFLVGGLAVSKSESWSLTQSIREFVRLEVEEVLMKTSSKREVAREASSKENIRKDVDYVKLEDLTDIVSKLVSRNVVESALETNSEQLQDTADKVLSLEENLRDLSARMKAVEESVGELKKGFLTTSAGSQRSGGGMEMSKSAVRFQLPEDEHRFLPKAWPRVDSVSKIGLPVRQKDIPSKSSDEDDDSEDLETNLSSTAVHKDKPCIYTEFMNRIGRKTGGQQSSPASSRSPLQSADPGTEADLQKRLAERHQFETNMFWYKKSPLTLQVDNHKNPYPNGLRDAAPGPLNRGPRQHSNYPRLARPGAPNSSDDGQSDWLFEQ